MLFHVQNFQNFDVAPTARLIDSPFVWCKGMMY